MPTPRPALTFERPILEPAQFHPTQVWTEKAYIFRYDAKRQICKRSPINSNALTGTMFFAVSPAAAGPKAKAAATAPKKRPRGLGPKLAMGGLWAVFIVAAIIFIYPLWPEVAYRVQQLHPAPAVSLATTPPATPVAATTAATATTAAAHSDPAPSAATAANQIPITDNRVIVPAIGVDTPIVEGSSLKVLDKTEGVWHQTGSVNHGNLVLAGHRFRYLPPNTSTLYNLNKLKVGDLIAVDWLGKRTVYQVSQMEVVPESDVSIINPTATPRLTLYSCNDIRETQRVVAIATPLPTP